MQNTAGEDVELYTPRRCAATNKLITAKDCASINIQFAEIDPATGVVTGTTKNYSISGRVRRLGESDESLTRLTKEDGILAQNY